jgi:hypothetical protein
MHKDLPVPAAYGGIRDVWVNAILQNMSLRLQKRDTLGDFRSPVEFRLLGNVGTFGGNDGLTITPNTPVTKDAILNQLRGYTFVMVKGDVLCGNDTGNFGCTTPKNFWYRPFSPDWEYYPSIVVTVNGDNVPIDTEFNGFLWAHEFGHRKGLNYEERDDRNRIMHPKEPGLVPPEGTTVTEKEARAFRKNE